VSIDQSQSAEARETARIEAFSDGIFAVAATLLVLDLKVPHDAAGGQGLVRALAAQWPSYLAFVTSFAFIGIMWINHHRLFTLIRRSDNPLLVFNALLLLGVTVVPFVTALLSEYIPRDGAPVAAAVYSGTYTLVAVFFNLLWHHASHQHRLLDRKADPATIDAITRGYRFGPLLYLVTFVLAFVSVPASLTMNLALAIFFALPSQNPLVGRKTAAR
jgi:uncharacterized membrane protein